MIAPLLSHCGLPDATREPKLAVVVACYNYERFIGRAIRSVADQHCRDCELVVVDDGSTDGSWEAIRRTGATAFKIPNSGQRAACLFGLEQTRAPFILFLDADDELKPGSLAKIINLIGPDISKLQFGLTRIDAEGQNIGNVSSQLEAFRSREVLISRVLRTGVYRTPPTSGNVFRRDLCELLREVDYDRAVDGVILFAAPLFGEVISISDELGYYRIHDRNDSGVGRLPDLRTFERDIARFVLRMAHLRRILAERDPQAVLIDPRQTYYYRELQFFAEISGGRRPRLTTLPRLLALLSVEYFSVKQQFALAIFIVLVFLSPDRGRRALLLYRLRCGNRSLRRFMSSLFKRPHQPQPDPSTAEATP